MHKPIVKRAPIIIIERHDRPARRVPLSRQARVLLVCCLVAWLGLNGYFLGAWAIAAFWGIVGSATRRYADASDRIYIIGGLLGWIWPYLYGDNVIDQSYKED